MDVKDLIQEIFEAREEIGVKSNKFTGAVTVEIIRKALIDEGIPVSFRDVYIKGVPTEFDLLIPKKNAKALWSILYAPKEVLAVFEIKFLGAFGSETVVTIRRNFEQLKVLNQEIYCAYLTVTELRGYKYKITPEELGFSVYTLSWHRSHLDPQRLEFTKDWELLIQELKTRLHNN